MSNESSLAVTEESLHYKRGRGAPQSVSGTCGTGISQVSVSGGETESVLLECQGTPSQKSHGDEDVAVMSNAGSLAVTEASSSTRRNSKRGRGALQSVSGKTDTTSISQGSTGCEEDESGPAECKDKVLQRSKDGEDMVMVSYMDSSAVNNTSSPRRHSKRGRDASQSVSGTAGTAQTASTSQGSISWEEIESGHTECLDALSQKSRDDDEDSVLALFIHGFGDDPKQMSSQEGAAFCPAMKCICLAAAVVGLTALLNARLSVFDFPASAQRWFGVIEPSSYPSSYPSSFPSSVPSEYPTKMPSSSPSFIPSTDPSSEPSGQPSVDPTASPSLSPTFEPTQRPTAIPTFWPTTISPTLGLPPTLAPSAPAPITSAPLSTAPTTSTPTYAPISKVPTLRPTSSPTIFSGYRTFSFYVMGDVPYSKYEEETLKEQLREISHDHTKDDALFIVHVGDILQKRRYECVASTYENVANIFLRYSNLPVIVLPGDNDWIDCDYPDWAWDNWTSSFIGFERNWLEVDESSSQIRILRQATRKENFSFTHEDVLVLGLNIVGQGREDDPAAYDSRYEDCYNFVGKKLEGFDGRALRAVIVFGHASRYKDIFRMLEEKLAVWGIPAVYIHGNGHKWEITKPFEKWDYREVQVDQGGKARPLKVTVRGTTDEALDKPFHVEDEYQYILSEFIKLDRQGGLYDDGAHENIFRPSIAGIDDFGPA